MSELCCNQEEFNKAKLLHEEALSESNYKVLLQFENPQDNTSGNRLRKVISFNLRSSQNVKKHHKLTKIFNKNTLKVSYCWMENKSSFIKQHNVRILSTESTEKRSCDCKNKECCSLEGYCLMKCMVCETKISTENNFKLYYLHAKENLNPVFKTTQNYFEM